MLTNFSINLRTSKHLFLVNKLPLEEVRLQSLLFSRSGQITEDDIGRCLIELHQANKKIVLEWNLLLGDSEIQALEETFAALVPHLSAVRFSDPGLGLFLAERYPNIPLHFELGQRCLNVPGVLGWSKTFGDSLKRLILSNQLPISSVGEIRLGTNLEIELLGLGRIEVFYSERKLLSSHFGMRDEGWLETQAASEDRPKQVSDFFEGPNGTLMYYDRDLFILDYLDEIEKAGVDLLAMEFYQESQYQWLSELIGEQDWVSDLKKRWPKKTTKGFYKTNQTHKPFSRLTNKHLRQAKPRQLAFVMESVKDSHVVIEVTKNFVLPFDTNIVTPEGKKFSYCLRTAKRLNGMETATNLSPGFYILPWIKYAVTSSILTKA
ncbi:MAG: U32 family peptidase [Deltaproteobacteria bacterium]|nr:U32 family peptidase [Deltaproteobacteria bacterium]